MSASSVPLVSSRSVIVHVITGFLGSGKTNVLMHLLGTPSPEGRFGVVVGEYADEGYDGGVLEETGHIIRMVSGLSHSDRGSVYLPALQHLVESGRHARVFLETSGVSEAYRLRSALLGDPSLASLVQWGRTTVVVDAGAFRSHISHFGPQMRAQLGLADLVVINKTDKVGPADLDWVRQQIKGANPAATVQFAYMGQVHRPSFWSPLADGGPSQLLRFEPTEEDLTEFDAFVYRTPMVAWDRVRFGHLLLNLPAKVARFKGVLRGWDRCWAVNGLPGQLDWDNRVVQGATRIGIIGVGVAAEEERLTALLDAELTRQAEELKR